MSGKSKSAAPAETPQSKIKNGLGAAGSAAKVKYEPRELSAAEKTKLAKIEAVIRSCQTDQAGDFHKLLLACHQILDEKLYEEHHSVGAFFKSKFGYSRAHAFRVAH